MPMPDRPDDISHLVGMGFSQEEAQRILNVSDTNEQKRQERAAQQAELTERTRRYLTFLQGQIGITYTGDREPTQDTLPHALDTLIQMNPHAQLQHLGRAIRELVPPQPIRWQFSWHNQAGELNAQADLVVREAYMEIDYRPTDPSPIHTPYGIKITPEGAEIRQMTHEGTGVVHNITPQVSNLAPELVATVKRAIVHTKGMMQAAAARQTA